MAVYNVDGTNWNSVAFWSGISETTFGHTLNFAALGPNYSVVFDAPNGLLTIDDGTTTFAIGDSGYAGTPDVTLGGATLLEYFTKVTSPDLADTVIGGSGDDEIEGGFRDDSLLGNAGNDTLDGMGSHDTLDGGSGTNQLIGAAGDDLFRVATGDGATNTITGGETDETGGDTLSFAGPDAVSLSFTGDEAGTYNHAGGSGTFSEIEIVAGSTGNDTLDAAQDTIGLTLSGGGGDDSLVGGSGSDTLLGGDGDDTLTAGSGDDVQGQGGDDVFNVTPGSLNGSALTIVGGESSETAGDTLNITGPAIINMTGAESGTVTWGDGSVLTFSEIENVNYTACFTTETRIATQQGERRAADLRVGDRVLTFDNGYQPVGWVGQVTLTEENLFATPQRCPIRIPAGALGHGRPARDMLVSPQHRVLFTAAATDLYMDEPEVLIAAQDLTGLPGIRAVLPEGGVTYVHFLCDRHELVLSDGHWTESFQPGDLSLAGFDAAQRAELFTLFPDLAQKRGRAAYAPARSCLKSHQARVLLRGAA